MARTMYFVDDVDEPVEPDDWRLYSPPPPTPPPPAPATPLVATIWLFALALALFTDIIAYLLCVVVVCFCCWFVG